MSNRNFDMSNFIRRQSNKVAAQSFLSRIQPPNNQTGSAPYLGISSYSIMNEVRSGSMTEIARSDYGGCYTISVGCPCPEVNSYFFIPSGVSNIQIAFGSIILSWNAPADPNNDKGPFQYQITPYLNGVALESVITSDTSYTFNNLDEFKPYTFEIVAINRYGKGPSISNGSAVIMPPSDLSAILTGKDTSSGNMPNCLKYIQGNAIEAILKYIASINLGPTRSSRLMYLWSASVAQAWNWVSLSQRQTTPTILGTKDNWDWDTNSKVTLNDCDKVVWITLAIDTITSILSGSTYTSKFTYDTMTVQRVQSEGQWDNWLNTWNAWRATRANDGSVVAGTTMPTSSSNWEQTIVVDGATVSDINSFPAPQEWTRLTVQGKKQGYLTWNWDSVTSTCFTADDETLITYGLAPKTGVERDEEIDWVVTITHEMGDPKYNSDSDPLPYMNPDLRKLQAEFWAGGPGTVSPPCMFVWMWCQYVRGLSDISADKLIYSLLDLCIHLFEGGRLTWRLKKQFMEARPIQEIRRRYAGVNLYSWDGSIVKGDQWIPYQEANFVTPPFADFPSGHSHFSKAFALTMASWFGELQSGVQVDYCNPKLISPLFKENSISSVFGSFTFDKGVSSIQPGVVPNKQTVLSWNTWDDMATSAGMSRIYGGIHCLTAHEASQTVAENVDSQLVSKWAIRKDI